MICSNDYFMENNLMTDVKFTSRCYYPINSIISFEIDMINYSKSSIFQSIEVLPTQDPEIVQLSFNIPSEQKCLVELIDSLFFDKDNLHLFIHKLIELKRYCEEHFLEIERVDFNPNNIFYDAHMERFKWRYLPVSQRMDAYGLSDLITTLFIYSSEQLKIPISYFKNIQNDLDQLSTLLLEQENKSSKNSIWFSKIFHTKHLSSREHMATKTNQTVQYPMIIDKTNPLDIYKIYYDKNSIGRDETCNIYINDHSISRKHATIIKRANQFFIIDLNSTNGVLVNNHKISVETSLLNGDNIQIGNKHFIFIR